MSPELVRVLIVDDSGLARELLSAMLARDPQVEVVGTAGSGEEAVARTHQLKPSIVVMDIGMPGMGGLRATAEIMASAPCPVLLISADTSNLEHAFEALALGALDVQPKPSPSAPSSDAASVASFLRRVKVLSTVKVIHHRGSRAQPAPAAGALAHVVPRRAAPSPLQVVAVASSTGGPAALATLLGALRSDLDLAVVVVQHTALGFDVELVRWMNRESAIPVVLGADGATLRAGEAVIAPTSVHMQVTAGATILLADSPPVAHQRPSGNVLLTSVADAFGAAAIGVVLTGMGNDGTHGAAAIRRAGGHTIAQDEATSTVWGMPKAAIDFGAIDAVLPIGSIADHIIRRLGSQSRRSP